MRAINVVLVDFIIEKQYANISQTYSLNLSYNHFVYPGYEFSLRNLPYGSWAELEYKVS